MPTLNPVAVAAAAAIGGFPDNELVDAVAVAHAESSWNTDSFNSCCFGLWQIHKTAHSDLWNQHLKGDGWKDPIRNAMVAHTIWQRAGGEWCARGSPPNGCNPWQAYGNSNYKGALGPARSAVNRMKSILQKVGWSTTELRENVRANPLDQQTKMVMDQLGLSGSGLGIDLPGLPGGDFMEAMQKLHEILQFFTNRHNWIRTGVGLAGLGLIWFAILPFVIKGGVKVLGFLPQGKIAKAAVAAKGGKLGKAAEVLS